jgi:GGDEF domain-containing protein
MMIFPNIREKKNLEELGERLRMLVEKAFFFWEGHRIEGTMSLGGTLGRPEDSSQDVFSRADRALYESKEGGKNRVTIL